jgi:hypothetical protein
MSNEKELSAEVIVIALLIISFLTIMFGLKNSDNSYQERVDKCDSRGSVLVEFPGQNLSCIKKDYTIIKMD